MLEHKVFNMLPLILIHVPGNIKSKGIFTHHVAHRDEGTDWEALQKKWHCREYLT
jgi:hypothetical protein